MILRSGRRSGTTLFLALVILLAASSANAVMPVPPMFDDAGRPNAITHSAQRVVSLAPALTELVYAANAADKLVGVSAYSDYPEAAKLKPQVADAADYRLVLRIQHFHTHGQAAAGNFATPSLSVVASARMSLLCASRLMTTPGRGSALAKLRT